MILASVAFYFTKEPGQQYLEQHNMCRVKTKATQVTCESITHWPHINTSPNLPGLVIYETVNCISQILNGWVVSTLNVVDESAVTMLNR